MNLVVKAASEKNSSSDRAALDTEKIQLLAEIDRVANTTTWAGQNLLDGTFDTTSAVTSVFAKYIATSDGVSKISIQPNHSGLNFVLVSMALDSITSFVSKFDQAGLSLKNMSFLKLQVMMCK